jgi:hypothetical protein
LFDFGKPERFAQSVFLRGEWFAGHLAPDGQVFPIVAGEAWTFRAFRNAFLAPVTTKGHTNYTRRVTRSPLKKSGENPDIYGSCMKESAYNI